MNDFTKAGKPRNWRGQKSKIEELEEKLAKKEDELSLAKECYAKEIDRLKLAVSDHEKTIKKQGQEITKLTNYSATLKADREAQDKVISGLMNRSLWERIINKEIEP
jgi:chromosome segregation ATPase